MVGIIEASGTTLGIALIILLRYIQTGQIPILDTIKQNQLDKELGNQAHQSITDNLEDIRDNTDETLAKVNGLQNTILYLHSDEIKDNSLLRNELDVENDHDFLNNE